MSVLRALRRGIDALWFAPTSPYPIAAFRILLGLYLLVYFGTLAPHTRVLFSRDGVYVPFLVPDFAPPVEIAWIAMAALLGLSAALTLGLWTRWVVPVLLVVYLHHYLLALAVKDSAFERLIVIYLVALVPAQANAVWAWRRRSERAHAGGAEANAEVTSASFTPRILRFQTIMLYLGAGLWKLGNVEWHGPHLLRATLQSIWANPLAFQLVRLGWSDATWAWISRSVIAFELLLAALLLVRRTRWLGVALGVGFHALNCVVLALPEFLICVAPYVFFLPPEHVERIGRGLGALGFSRRSRADG